MMMMKEVHEIELKKSRKSEMCTRMKSRIRHKPEFKSNEIANRTEINKMDRRNQKSIMNVGITQQTNDRTNYANGLRERKKTI